MNSHFFLQTLTEGTDREVSDLSYQLLNIDDMKQLKELSLVTSDAENLKRIKPGQKTKLSADRQLSLNRIISRLQGIASGQCTCNRYLICMYFPMTEQKLGRIRILLDQADHDTYESYFECECVLCHGKFQVREFEAGFGRRAKWTAQN